MAKKPIKYTAIPRGNTDKAVSALSTIAETLIGAKGNGLEKAVTFRDLENLELVSIRRSLDGRNFIFDPIDPGTGGDDDVVTPTQPTNFQAIGGFTSILLTWDYPTYPGHSFTEIWRAETNVLGEAALLVGTNSLNYSDIPGNNFSGYYWIRHVNVNNTPGPFNDTAGTLGETAEDVAFNLDVLNGRIADIHLNSLLSDKIDLVQVNADAVAVLDELVDNNKIATDNALIAINTVTIPGIENQIDDINNAFPDYATLAYANSEFLNQTEVDSAISGRINTFYTSVVQDEFVSNAFLQTNYRTESATDTAISQAINTFFTTTISPTYATTAFLQTNYLTETQTDSAISTAITDLMTNTIGPDYATTAFITTNYRTESATDSAISSALTNFLSTTISPTYATSAFLTNNYRTETNTDTAIATQVTGLRSEIFNGTGTALQSAFVSNLDSAISNAGGSIASSLSSLSATLNSPTTVYGLHQFHNIFLIIL